MALHSSAHPVPHQAAPSPDISDPSDISRRTALAALPALGLASLSGAALLLPRATHAQTPAGIRLQSWPLKAPSQTGIHDIAPAPDGGVWFSAQRSGHLGWLDPTTGKTELIALGKGSSPHGVIAGPDGAAWLTDGGQNAIVRVSWPARQVKVYPLPAGTPYANLNTCAFDGDGDLWFTGQSGYVGKVEVRTGTVTVKESPAAAAPTASAPHPKATSGGAHSQATSSHSLTAKQAPQASSSHPPNAKAPAGSGQTAKAASGCLNGTAETCRCTTPSWARHQQLENLESPRQRTPRVCRLRRQQRHRLGLRVEQQRHAAL
jgi:hypothetical protein